MCRLRTRNGVRQRQLCQDTVKLITFELMRVAQMHRETAATFTKLSRCHDDAWVKRMFDHYERLALTASDTAERLEDWHDCLPYVRT